MLRLLNALVFDEERVINELLAEYAGAHALLVRKSELVQNYSALGTLQRPVNL